jgi:hypothetical protein
MTMPTRKHIPAQARRLVAAALAILTTACAQHPSIEPVLVLGEVHSRAPADALYAAGKAHLQAGRVGLAVHTLEAARLQAPTSVRVLNGLGAAYDRLGRHHLADKVYLEAIALSPDDPMTLNNLGWSRHLRGQPELAEYYLQQAVEVDPRNETAQANLIHVMAALPVRRQQAPPDMNVGPGPRIERVEEGVQQLVFAPLPAVSWPPRGSTPVDTIEREPVLIATRVADIPVPQRSPVTLSGLRLEIANGTGRTRMAARFGDWLRSEGLPGGRLRNAAHFSHERTVVSYRDPANKAAARRLAALLPSATTVQMDAQQGSDLRVVLGADLLAFDSSLMTAITEKRNSDDVPSLPTV